MLIALYLAAIVAANLTIAALGPSAVLWVGFLLIGLTLVVRDRLHDLWGQENGFPLRMGALILGGAAATAVLQPSAGLIALASVTAFVVSELLDALVFHAARRQPWLARSNASNVVSAFVDSALFIGIAFGGPLYLIAAQWGVKVLGGLVWSLVMLPWARRVLPRHA